MKKFIMMLAIVILSTCLMACDKEESVNDKLHSEVDDEPQKKASGIVSRVDRSKAAKDLQNGDTLRVAFTIAVNDPEVYETVNDVLKEVEYICFEVKAINDVPEITCQNNKDMDEVIEIVKTQLTYLSGPSLKEDLDGSQIEQSQYYVVVSKDYSVRVYISGEGKTLEDLLSDTDCDGIYQCSPDVCSEYLEK